MIVIQGGTVLTVNDAGTVHFPGHVVIDGDRIAAVGAGAYPGEVTVGAEVIDASGMVVMPGMVDLHYHTAIGKGFCDHLPLLESLEEFWYPSIRALDPETAYWAALNSYAESIKCGVTTVNDMYRQLGALGRAAEEIGIRAVLSNDVALPEHELDTLQDNQDSYDAVHGLGDGRVQVYVGIEWLPLASPELLRDARRSPASWAPGSTCTSTSPSARWRTPGRGSAGGPPRWPTTPACSARTAWPRTACGSPTMRSG